MYKLTGASRSFQLWRVLLTKRGVLLMTTTLHDPPPHLHDQLAGPQPFATQWSYSGAISKANALFLASPFHLTILLMI
jgi:hypothetical protein